MAPFCRTALLKFKLFNGQGSKETHFAPCCHISRRSVKPLRYLWFSRWQLPPSWIFKNSKFWWSIHCSRPVWSPLLPDFLKMVKRLQRYHNLTVYQNGGHLPNWICWTFSGTTHDDYFVVFIVVQNLVRIDAAVSVIWKFWCFANLAWKRLFTPPKFGAWMANNINDTPKGTDDCKNTSCEPFSITTAPELWPVAPRKTGMDR